MNIADYHIHASFYRVKRPGSETGPTVAEQIAAARAAGTVTVGIVEHCNDSAAHPFHCLEELGREFFSLDIDRSETFIGVEADLRHDGSDHCGAEGRKKLNLDYVIGSVHLSPKIIPDVRDYIDEEYTRIINALNNNSNINIIGHPFGEGIRYEMNNSIAHWSYSLIPEKYLCEIIAAAKNSGKALEINRCLEDDEAYTAYLKMMRDAEVFFTVGSDAHFPEGVGDAAERTHLLEKLGFNEKYLWRPDK